MKGGAKRDPRSYSALYRERVRPGGGVTSATFDLHGAAGGSFAPIGFLPGGSGGKGGHVQATVALTPGATLVGPSNLE